MELRILALGLLMSVAALATGEDKKPEKLDPAKLLGDWQVVEGTKAGEKSGPDIAKGLAKIDKDKITFSADEAKFVFGYKANLEKSPVEVDLEILEPEGFKGAKALGILKLEDGKLTLCYHPMMGARPTKFESTKDNGNYLFVHKAAAKKEEKKPEPKKPN